MNWLLPAQTILDLVSAEPGPAHEWAGTVDTQALRISVVSVAQAAGAIQSVGDQGLRGRLSADLTSFLAELKADAVAPLAFTELHATIWSALMHESSIDGVPQTDRQVYATALYEGLTVVEEARAETAQLQALGIAIHVL